MDKKKKSGKFGDMARNMVVVVSLVLILGVVASVSLAQGTQIGFWDNVAEKLSNKLFGSMEVPDLGVMFGVSGTRFPNGVSADSTSPSAGQIRGTTLFSTAAVTVGTDLTATGGDTSTATTSVKRFTQGGGFFSTTTAETSATLSEFHILNYSGLEGSFTGGTMTYTLPASSTMTTMIPNIGDSMNWLLMPINNDITVAAGTGIDLKTASTSADFTVGAYGLAEIKFVRSTSTDVWALFLEYVN